MDEVILLMISISLLLAAAAVSALIWGLKGGQFGEQAAFLRLNDSENELNDAIKLEQRQQDFKAAGILFLDRDGVINQDIGYLHELEKLEYLPGIFELAQAAKKAGFLICVVTNQSGIARGYFDECAMQALHERISADFAAKNAAIRKWYFCPHAPDANCECRKPKPGMICEALKEFKKEPQNCIMLGDKASDLKAAKAAGISKRYLIKDHNDFKKVIDENFSSR